MALGYAAFQTEPTVYPNDTRAQPLESERNLWEKAKRVTLERARELAARSTAGAVAHGSGWSDFDSEASHEPVRGCSSRPRRNPQSANST